MRSFITTSALDRAVQAASQILTVICHGSSEFREDSGVGTYWMDTLLTLGSSVGLANALAFCEEYARQREFVRRDELQWFSPRRLAIYDAANRRVLGGRVAASVIEWAAPVTSDEEAERARIIIDQLNREGAVESSWDNYSTARGLWHRAELVEAHLVDPVWRTAVLNALRNRTPVSFL